MNIPDELLAAYVDGELHGAERARVEQAIAHDARLAQRVAQYRAMRARLRGGFDSALHEPMPQRMLQVARSASRPATAQVIDLARVRAERKRRNERRRLLQPHRIAIAASVLAGLLVGGLAERLWSDGSVTDIHNGELVAQGTLADTLNNQLTDSSTPGSRFHVGMTFRSKGGDYCRTFSETDNPALAGLACREQEQWRILTLVGSQLPAHETGAAGAVAGGAAVAGAAAAAGTAASADTTAGSQGARRVAWNLAPLLLQTVRQHISGQPLDARAEAKARGSDWR